MEEGITLAPSFTVLREVFWSLDLVFLSEEEGALGDFAWVCV